LFCQALKRFWSNNGDRISQQYTSTNSNITRVIQQGNQGFAGRMQQAYTGVQRYIANTFSDNDKNECIKLLLGRHISQKPYGFHSMIQKRLEEQRS
jgi:maltoporin